MENQLEFLVDMVNAGITIYRISKGTGISENVLARIMNNETMIKNLSYQNGYALAMYINSYRRCTDI